MFKSIFVLVKYDIVEVLCCNCRREGKCLHKKYSSTGFEPLLMAKALPTALEQYHINIQIGIAFANETKYSFRDMWMKNLMNGRRLNGEPEDMNF